MVSLKRIEDRPTPPEVYNWRIWMLAAIAASAAIMIGYDSAFVGGAIVLKGFDNDFGKLDVSTKANLVSTYQAGAFFGAFAGYPLGHFIGRRWGITICAIVFTIGAIIMVIANKSTGLGPIFGGRALAGLGIGAASNLAPIYISEIAVPAIRGQLVGLYEIGWQIGGLVGFFINYGVSVNLAPNTEQWRIPFAIQIIPGGLLVLGAPFLIESPRWLLTRNRNEEAATNLSRIRNLDGDHPYIVEELREMHSAVDKERKLLGSDSFWAPFRETFGTSRVLWRLVLGSSMFVFQNGTGINAINYYSPTVFSSLGITGANTGLLTTGIFGVIKTCGAIVWILFLIDNLGRRRILMTGASICSMAMLAIAIYIAVAKPADHAGEGLTDVGRFALACFYIWTLGYGCTWNGTPWVIGSEIFPQQSRTLGMACMAASNWLYNFAISMGTPRAFLNIGWGFYLIFCVVTLISIPYVFFLLPETKGVPLEHMDRLFEMRPRYNAGPRLLAELQVEHSQSFTNSHAGNVDAFGAHDRDSNGQNSFTESEEKNNLNINNADAGAKYA
ncbi:general substrate transporter [Meira miltonrushii]|uniref:Quinate transporter n=1 Tax=Meira miltonrushii TaxID=1280837 RepID=A0A316V678_9BASI|nr:general substrate transporter [Meira miltonrushii]PWN33099.1 general substrate transporter [Meira miltonrushii]